MPVTKPANPLARSSDLALLYPPFRARVELVLASAQADGLPAHVFEALRSFIRQEELYAQGRGLPGMIVTDARGDLSWHQYGLAVDFAFDAKPETPAVDWTWKGNWAKLGAHIQKAGLEWLGAPGSGFRETAHAQMSGGLLIREARELKARGGLPMVWAELDRRLKGVA